MLLPAPELFGGDVGEQRGEQCRVNQAFFPWVKVGGSHSEARQRVASSALTRPSP